MLHGGVTTFVVDDDVKHRRIRHVEDVLGDRRRETIVDDKRLCRGGRCHKWDKSERAEICTPDQELRSLHREPFRIDAPTINANSNTAVSRVFRQRVRKKSPETRTPVKS